MVRFLSAVVRLFSNRGSAIWFWSFLQIQHVVQLDFPRQTIDYLHRVGRTGRMGKPGKVSSLIGKYDVKLAVEIQVGLSFIVAVNFLSLIFCRQKSAKKALSLEDTKRARPVAQTPQA